MTCLSKGTQAAFPSCLSSLLFWLHMPQQGLAFGTGTLELVPAFQVIPLRFCPGWAGVSDTAHTPTLFLDQSVMKTVSGKVEGHETPGKDLQKWKKESIKTSPWNSDSLQLSGVAYHPPRLGMLRRCSACSSLSSKGQDQLLY